MVDGVPVPLGWHTEPPPGTLVGVESVRFGDVLGRAARSIAKGNEAIGDLITSLPAWFWTRE